MKEITRNGLEDIISQAIEKMKSEHPVWQKDYEAFMKTVGFQTKL